MLDATPPLVLLLALGLAVAAALVQSARLWWRRAAPAWRLQARARRAQEGEREAEALLRGHGYQVVGRQVTQQLELLVDGEPVLAEVRADLIVERDGRQLVAEVKTGRVAPRVEHPATRRQLLEYRVAFAVDGVLLVDAESGRVREVVFPLADTTPPTSSGLVGRLAWLLVGGAIGALAARFVRW